jgi:hypothetical protein
MPRMNSKLIFPVFKYLLNAVTKEAWNTVQSTEDKREKIQALSLAKECYSMKLELLTNATVIDMLLGL